MMKILKLNLDTNTQLTAGNERLSLTNELNKLILHIKATKNIVDALSILISNNSRDLNSLVYLLASRKKAFWNEFLKFFRLF